MTLHGKRLTPALVCFAIMLLGCQPNQRAKPSSGAALDPAAVSRSERTQLDLNHPLAFTIKDGHPVLIACSERIVEVPFVHRNLPYPFRGRVLDVGCRESELPFSLASLGFEAWGIDIRPPIVEYPGLRYIQGDIVSHPFPSDYFDVVTALSTIEHIGLAVYGNKTHDTAGDLHSLQAIHRILKPTGRLILTVPFGIRGATRWYRVYDHESLLSLLSGAGFVVKTEDYWLQEGLRWTPSSWAQAERVDSVSTDIVKGLACIVAERASSSARRP